MGGASSTIPVAEANREQLRAWDGDEGAYWAANADDFDRSVGAHHRLLLEAAAITPTDRVLDVGCGTGQTTREAAQRATSGSALGCLILYMISRRAGARALNRFSEAKRNRVKNWIERYDMFAVLAATLLPPPFPFKLFVVTAGVFRFSLVRFMLAIVVGRGFRFLLEGYFAVRYGAQAKEILAKYYPWIGLGLVVGIVIFVLLRQKLKRPEILTDEHGSPV